MQLVQVLLALMSALLSTCSPHRTCHACLPATYYVLLLPFPRASAICVCAKSDARCPSTSIVLLFPSLPRAPYTTFPHALTLSPLLSVGRGPAPWPDKQLCVAVSSLCRCFKHFLSAPHLATPTNFFLHLAFSGPLSSPHAYATRAGPTLDWPLSSYKPGSPRALTCSPLRACQSCLPGAQRLIRVAPISHLLCGLLALSSASLPDLSRSLRAT